MMPNLRVKSVGLTSQQAVEVFRDTPEDARWSRSVGLRKCPAFRTMGGSPVAVGFPNASALTVMIELSPAAERPLRPCPVMWCNSVTVGA